VPAIHTTGNFNGRAPKRIPLLGGAPVTSDESEEVIAIEAAA
jgi:hypothetical protein